jgi:hypothetical protein
VKVIAWAAWVTTELREAAIGWSGLTDTEIDAAVEILTLTADWLRQDGQPFWEQERRSYRLATRPLISLGGDRLLLIPRRLEATQGLIGWYLLDGRIPWPDLPRKVSDAFNDYRAGRNRQLELAVDAILGQLPLTATTNIKVHVAAAAGLHVTGEVDALAADPERSRLWVCEVKDQSASVSPSRMASLATQFLKPGGYIDRLVQKADDISADSAGWAKFLAASQPEQAWRVLPLMITRQVEPAAFASEPVVPFVVLADLAMLLQSSAEPPAGQVPPASGLPANG